MDIIPGDLATSTQAIRLLRVCARTFYKAKERGDLPEPVLRLGGRVYYSRSQLEGLNIKRPRGGWKARKAK